MKIQKIIFLFITFIIYILSFNNSFARREICKEKIIENASNPVFSPDGKSFAYITQINWDKFVIKDWIKSEKYKDIENLIFSPDSKSFAYKAEKDWKSFIIKDWKKGKEYDGVWFPFYSSDSKYFAYFAAKDERAFLVKDWIEYWNYENLNDDNSNYIFFSVNKENYIVKNWIGYIVNFWIEWIKYSDIENLTLSPNWKSFAYKITKEWKTSIIKDWKNISWKYDEVWFPFYSSDSKTFLYIAKKDELTILVKDWIEYLNFFNNDNDTFIKSEPLFSPDWNSFLYLAENYSRYFIVKNWVKWKEYDYIDKNMMSFSPNSKSFAYIVETDWKYFIVKDWVEWKKYDKISNLIYSPDSKSIVFNAIIGDINSENYKFLLVKKTCEETNPSKNIIYQDIKTEANTIIIKDKKYYTKLLITSKLALKNNKNNTKYISQIDKLVSWLDEKKSKALLLKTQNNKIKTNTNNYLEAKLFLKLNK